MVFLGAKTVKKGSLGETTTKLLGKERDQRRKQKRDKGKKKTQERRKRLERKKATLNVAKKSWEKEARLMLTLFFCRYGGTTGKGNLFKLTTRELISRETNENKGPPYPGGDNSENCLTTVRRYGKGSQTTQRKNGRAYI